MSISGIALFKVSCSNLERSVAFYQQLGFNPLGPVTESDAPWLGPLYGVPGASVRAQQLAGEADPKRMRIELIEWANAEAPARGPNRPGAGMLALSTNDFAADRQSLLDAGIPFESEPVEREGPTGTTWLVNFRDPDGLPIQLVQFVKKVDPPA